VIAEARNFAEKLLKGRYLNFTLNHTRDVVELCRRFGRGLDMDVLLTAAWLHDIGRAFTDDDHHRVGAELAACFLRILGAEDEFIERVRHCIEEHGTDGRPKTEEAKLLREIDGVSVFRWDFVLLYLLYFRNRDKMRKILEKASKKVEDNRLREVLRKRYAISRLLVPGVRL